MTEPLTAEQKVRELLSGNPFFDPVFQHEGDDVVRWITGGTLPDVWVTFRHRDREIEVRCAGCHQVLGVLPQDYEKTKSVEVLTAVRLAGHDHRQERC